MSVSTQPLYMMALHTLAALLAFDVAVELGLSLNGDINDFILLTGLMTPFQNICADTAACQAHFSM